MDSAAPPPVAAEDVLVVVETYADRLHDLLRRRGIREAAAAQLVTSTALELVDSAANRPPADVLGWWVRRLLERSGGAATTWTKARADADKRLTAALAALAAPLALAVRLRDDYDVPPGSLAVAMGTDQRLTDGRVARARAELLLGLEERPGDLHRHEGREPADPGQLGRYADGSLPAAAAKGVSRHIGTCRACESFVEGQQRARRMLAALPVQAMSDEDRTELLQRVGARAAAVLLPLSEVLLDAEERAAENAARPLVSLPTILAVLAAAAVLGGVIGAVTASDGGHARATDGQPGAIASTAPAATLTATPTGAAPTATATAVAPRTPSARPSRPSPTPSRGPVVPGDVTLRITPTSGANNQELTVLGTGWVPGSTVRVTYVNPLGQQGSQATGVVGDDGTFVTRLVAHDDLNLPGRHAVRATDGRTTREVGYTAQA